MREIQYEELRRELSVADWRAWVNDVLADLRSTDEGREYMRFDKGPIKRLKEEVVPTLHLVERHFANRPMFARFPADNQSADALIRPSLAATPIQLQITCDFDHAAHQRLMILHRDGFVQGSGPISKVNGRLETKGRAYSLEEIVDEFAAVLIDRLESKMSRCTDPRMWLLVHLSDEGLPPEGAPELLRRTRAVACRSPFAATFLVGNTDWTLPCELLSGSPLI
jgi:hypothetical protein